MNKNRIFYANILFLDNQDRPLESIQGQVISGNININGKSPVRRTINMTLRVLDEKASFDYDKLLKKRIKIYTGLLQKNNEIEWKNQGIFIITSATTQKNLNSWTINLQGKDKMVLLDGSVGGKLPAQTVFHEMYDYDEKGQEILLRPTIFQIISEAVHHFGGEPISNILISDIPDKVKMLVKYVGKEPIYFDNNYNEISFSSSEHTPIKKSQGDDVGYQITDFIYPGELILNAGESVVTLLNRIVSVLGNYEFFYNLQGQFIFQKKHNYIDGDKRIDQITSFDYVKAYGETSRFNFSLLDDDSLISVNKTPKFDNIKNDYLVLGERTTSYGGVKDLIFHLAIEDKPEISLANCYMWEVTANGQAGKSYIFSEQLEIDKQIDKNYELKGYPCQEWREELYRLALQNNIENDYYSYYYPEIKKEWRNIFDTVKWKESQGWNPVIQNNIEEIEYWIDFIDTNSDLSKYSIKNIGRRTVVKTTKEIGAIFNNKVPDIIFINREDKDELKTFKENFDTNQKFFFLSSNMYDLFSISGTKLSAFDEIRKMIYEHLNYNSQINLSIISDCDIKVNELFHIYDKNLGIRGNYEIISLSIPLQYAAPLNLTGVEVFDRI